MVKKPYRTISRSCFTSTEYIKDIDRYRTGVGLCELAVNQGVPILQQWAIALMVLGKLQRPLGCVDKAPAIEMGNDFIKIEPISMTTRSDFDLAFGIGLSEQIKIETELAGVLVNKPSLQLDSFIQKYKTFHLK